MAAKRLRSASNTPAASVVGSSSYDTPRSAAGGSFGSSKTETWTEEHIPHKRGTRKVIYPNSVFGPLTHLGEDGAFGTCFSSTRLRDGTAVVIKQEPLDESPDCEACMRELSVLTYFAKPHMGHPNIIDCVKAWESDDSLYIVLPKLQCSLHTYLNENLELPAEKRTIIFSQVLSGIRHLHHHGLMHRDLKPENVVLNRDLQTLKLIDFGTTRTWVEGSLQTRGKYVSTFPYRAPESDDGSFSAASDIWALGCMLARMISGRTLFNGKETALSKDRANVMERIKPLESRATPYEFEILCMMLRLDPKERISTEDLYEVHYEHTKDHKEPMCRVPRVSRREVPKSLQYVPMEYNYDHIPTMRRNVTVLTTQCQRLLR